MECRVCAAPIERYALDLSAPGITSLSTPIDAPTKVALCNRCGHAQSPEPAELAQFYDTEYKISLQSDDFDQLYGVADGQEVFRTEQQVNVMLGLTSIEAGMRVLDYGAAKAQSLRRLIAARPDIRPYVFDVSKDYEAHWREFLPADQTATYRLPEAWRGTMDLVTTYFVLEHVAEPVVHLAELAAMLRPDGRLFAMVPNAITNPGDLLVVDHVNHFTTTSVHAAFAAAGLEILASDANGFRGAVGVLARREGSPKGPGPVDVADTLSSLAEECRRWSDVGERLAKAVASRPDQALAVHGAGFYGAVAMQLLRNADVQVVLDSNPYLQGTTFFGRPVVAPHRLPAHIDTVVLALSPAVARQVARDPACYGRPMIDTVRLDEAPASAE